MINAPARGTATKVSDPQHTILARAESNGGYVPRGGDVAITQLLALAKRHYVTLVRGTWDGRRGVVVGAWLTGAGKVRLSQLDQIEREADEWNATMARMGVSA